MLSSVNYLLVSVFLLLFSTKTCTSDRLPPSLVLYSPGVPEYSEVLVKRVNDELHLVCELRGDATPRMYVWNYMPDNGTSTVVESSLSTVGPGISSNLTKLGLQVSDSGYYMCSSPPFSVTKYILVQTRGPLQCALGAFWCGSRCVLADYVCDGRRDCLRGEDEAPAFCHQHLCQRADKLNCTGGRCIPEAACCRPGAALCVQPACCDEYPRYSRIEGVGVGVGVGGGGGGAGFVEEALDPPLFEDRHAPDDYGFIQSTIYTVTACALIFMIAVVLLVSAICKMHMKRAALRSYAHAERATRHHYNMHYAQAHRFPPCYEASRLLEAAAADAPHSPQHAAALTAAAQATGAASLPECPGSPSGSLSGPGSPPDEPTNNGFGLARLSSIFSSRYRQVPTQPDVEMTNVRSTSLNNSPTRNRTLDNYRSPTYCDLNAAEFYFTNPEASDCGRDLNYMATPVDFFRRRAMRRNTLERVMDQIDRQRLTLQLGRFQFTLPTFGRRSSTDRRPDTPNVAEINIEDLDFVRLNSNDTYTLNGRTIRLLGANFENYPVMPDGSVRPPPYTEAMRYKLYGPPPEYLSREGLNNTRETRVDQDAQTNVEMPPCYDDLASGGNPENNENLNNNVITDSGYVITDIGNVITDSSNNNGMNTTSPNTVESINSIIDNLPAIDSDVNANDSLLTGVINNVDAVITNGNE